ncbi:MAG: TolC family protein [Rikenellaceae bacterium]
MDKRILALAACLTLLSSCGIYTKFESPEVEDSSIVGSQVALNDESIVELPSWRDYFTDPKLQSLIEVALESNSDLQIASLNITQAQRSLTTARLAMLPTISFSAQGTVTNLTSASYSLPLSASWELDVFGRKRNASRQASSVVEQTKEYELMVQTQLIEAVALNYYALILADQQLSITGESLAIMEESLASMQLLMEVGILNRVALEQAKASYNSIELAIETLKASVLLTSNNLNLLLNLPPQNIERSDAITLSSIDIEPSISLSALSARPDVRYAEAQLSQSFYGVNYARSSLYPSITIGGSVTYTAGDFILSALASLTQPIFAAGANLANLANAKDIYQQQLLAFEKSLLNAGKEVNDAIVSNQAAQRKSVIAQTQVSTLLDAVNTTQALMDSGSVNYLEVLTAQSSYLSARVDHATYLYNEAVAQINLYKALGGGVQ